MSSISTRRRRAPEPEFVTDAEGATLLNLGITRFLQLQQTDPDFPPPVWFGPRGKRHVRERLMAWALARTERVSA